MLTAEGWSSPLLLKLRKLSKIITTSNFSAPNATCRDFQEKRSSYPRLYFLSDEDLLELVSASGRGLEVHLPKLYQGVGSIIRDDNGLTAVVSPEGEILQLSKPVDLRDPLSQWLSNLEERMKSTLRQHLEKCLVDTAPDRSFCLSHSSKRKFPWPWEFLQKSCINVS